MDSKPGTRRRRDGLRRTAAVFGALLIVALASATAFAKHAAWAGVPHQAVLESEWADQAEDAAFALEEMSGADIQDEADSSSQDNQDEASGDDQDQQDQAENDDDQGGAEADNDDDQGQDEADDGGSGSGDESNDSGDDGPDGGHDGGSDNGDD